MYCDNCHRQSPDNFVNCPYCAAPLKNGKRKKPQKFVKKKENKKPISFKTMVILSVIVALVLALSAVVTGVLTGSKPEKIINEMVTAIEADDAELYYSLYDDQMLEYYKENWYYADEETFDAVTKPLRESRAFYTSKCGENFTLDYKITDTTYVTDEELDFYEESLAASFNYKEFPSKLVYVDFVIEAKGESGTYKSVYENFVCIQIKGKWYIQPAATDVLENATETAE